MMGAMNREPHESNVNGAPCKPWQSSLLRMFVATTLVALVFACAAWGGWVKSDAPVYLAIAVLAGVFSATARWALLGAFAILTSFWIAASLSGLIFGPNGRSLDPRSAWIFAALLVVSAALLRVCGRSGAVPFLASLLLIELFIAAVVIYTYGHSTLFAGFATEDRQYLIQHFRRHFCEQRWYIVAPWLLGIAVGEAIGGLRKMRRSASRRDVKAS